jgi:prepilin-type N-terminal cleavage/methylation domain-containing protein
LAAKSSKIAGGLRAARAARAGFTLVEIAVVVVLMGLFILVVVVGGYFSFRNREQLKDEARSLAGFLENVRTLAAISGKRYTVEYSLDEDEQTYFCWAPRKVEEGDVVETGGDEEETRMATGFHPMPTRTRGDGSRVYAVWIDRIGFGDGSSTDDQEVKIDFMPTGGGHWHMVYLRNDDDEFYTVVVNPFTGSAEVYPGEYKAPEPERLR